MSFWSVSIYSEKLTEVVYRKMDHQIIMTIFLISAFMLYTLNVAMAFAFLSSLYGDFMKVSLPISRLFSYKLTQYFLPLKTTI